MIRLENADLSADIASLGAELVRLRDSAGRDYLWDGDPAFWKGRAPLLFPIVGKVPDDRLLVDGVSYPMRQHGLARISVFEQIARDETSCLYRLESSPDTLLAYPFAFRLGVRYALAGATLTIEVEVANRGATPMPASFGFHPALRWPLPGNGAKTGHALVFEKPEAAPIRRLRGGLLTAEAMPTPVGGKTLPLSEDLFADDVVVFDRLDSRQVDYISPEGTAVRVRFPGMPHLGLWSKPGAGFLCIEPWQGYAAPEEFSGDLADKPGMLSIAPGAVARFAMSLELTR